MSNQRGSGEDVALPFDINDISFTSALYKPMGLYKKLTSSYIWEILNRYFSTYYTSFNARVRYFIWIFFEIPHKITYSYIERYVF